MRWTYCEPAIRSTEKLEHFGSVMFCSISKPQGMSSTKSPRCRQPPSRKFGHLRTHRRFLMKQPTDQDDQIYHRLASFVKLLPDLRVDTLTVIGSFFSRLAHRTLDELIKYGNGWKELRFIAPNYIMPRFTDAFADYPNGLDWHRSQPSTWEEILGQRDGTNLGASVTIYRSVQSDPPDAILDPRRRQIVKGVFPPKSGSRNANEPGGPPSMPRDDGNQVLFIIECGFASDIAGADDTPYPMKNDIRKWAYGMSWKGIRQCIVPPSEEELSIDMLNFICEGGLDGLDAEFTIVDDGMEENDVDVKEATQWQEEELEVLVDEYTNVDGFEWNLLY